MVSIPGPDIDLKNAEGYYPRPPQEGPPLPRMLNIFWPWYKAEEPPPNGEEPPEGDFKVVVTDLKVDPATVPLGDTVVITCTVTNTGTVNGSSILYLKVDGVPTATREVFLEPGESAGVSYDLLAEVEGSHVVAVNGHTASFVVSAYAPDFYYATGLEIERTNYPTIYDIEWSIRVGNQGQGDGVLHYTFAHRMESPYEPGEFAAWRTSPVMPVDILASGTKLIMSTLKLSPYCYELKFDSEAGIIVVYYDARRA